MSELPRAISLPHQTAELIRAAIAAGVWQDRLPGERPLSEKYQVSRSTVRTAVALLEREKLIRSEQGWGTRILRKAHPTPPPAAESSDVALLSPEPLERLRPTQTLWIDELRGMLSERGRRLRVFHGKKYFGRNPGRSLQRLVTENPHGCWILTLSNAAIQRWFSSNQHLRCVIAGSAHAGSDLPSRDIDHRAMCRHAVGVLLGLGHTKLAFLVAQSQLAGALESEAGFKEGVENSPTAKADAVVSYHDGTTAGISAAVRRLLQQARPPTGIIIGNTYHYLSVVGCLAQMGKRVPQDISLISRDDDPFLVYVLPAPARYKVADHALAKALLQLVLDLLDNKTPAQRVSRLMPEFTRGQSLAKLG